MLSWKQYIPGLNSRNLRTPLRDFYLEFHNFIYYKYLYRICILVLIERLLYKHINGLFGKNLGLYSPMGV